MSLDRDRAVIRIRSRLASGELPCESCLATWAGPGLARPCDGCGEHIAPEEYEVECDIPGGRMLRMHRECFLRWQEECEALLRRAVPPGGV